MALLSANSRMPDPMGAHSVTWWAIGHCQVPGTRGRPLGLEGRSFKDARSVVLQTPHGSTTAHGGGAKVQLGTFGIMIMGSGLRSAARNWL